QRIAERIFVRIQIPIGSYVGRGRACGRCDSAGAAWVGSGSGSEEAESGAVAVAVAVAVDVTVDVAVARGAVVVALSDLLERLMRTTAASAMRLTSAATAMRS